MLRSLSSYHLTLLLRIAPLVSVNMIFLRREIAVKSAFMSEIQTKYFFLRYNSRENVSKINFEVKDKNGGIISQHSRS